MSKKIINKLIALISMFAITFVFVGCNYGTEPFTNNVANGVGKNQADITDVVDENSQPTNDDKKFNFSKPIIENVVVDGKADEEYLGDGVVTIKYGNYENVTLSMYRGEESLFFFFNVVDNNILTEGVAPGDDVPMSDGVEIYLDTKLSRSTVPTDGVVSICIGANGATRQLGGRVNFWYPYSIESEIAVAIDGTLNNVDDIDKGYSVEVGIKYDRLGMTKDSSIGVSFGHVDKSTTVTGKKHWYGWLFNDCFIDPANPSLYAIYDGNYLYHHL